MRPVRSATWIGSPPSQITPQLQPSLEARVVLSLRRSQPEQKVNGRYILSDAYIDYMYVIVHT